jgi:hypothetical protein
VDQEVGVRNAKLSREMLHRGKIKNLVSIKTINMFVAIPDEEIPSLPMSMAAWSQHNSKGRN